MTAWVSSGGLDVSKRSTGKPTPTKPTESDFIDWREFDPSWLPGGEQAPLATELVTYRDRLDELLKHKGRFVAIKGELVLGYYRTRRAAVAAAFRQYGAVPVLVKQIVETEPARRLGNAAF
jgi:hypothetical protein